MKHSLYQFIEILIACILLLAVCIYTCALGYVSNEVISAYHIFWFIPLLFICLNIDHLLNYIKFKMNLPGSLPW